MKKSIVLLALLALATPSFAAGGFRLVANPSVRAGQLSKSAASAIFLKKTVKWDDGSTIIAVDQVEKSAVRATFTTAVHGKSPAAVKSFWQQQIFSGRDVPPVEKSSDSEVLAYIRSTAGAIGYVSEAADTSGLKVVEVN